MTYAPDIENSSETERWKYVKDRYPCISDCDMCGLCTVFHGKDPEVAYNDYFGGNITREQLYDHLRNRIGLYLNEQF